MLVILQLHKLHFLIRKGISTCITVECVAPKRLDSKRSGARRDINQGTLARADPGTFVPDFASVPVEPASASAASTSAQEHYSTSWNIPLM